MSLVGLMLCLPTDNTNVLQVNRTQLSVQLLGMLTCVEELSEGGGGGGGRGRVLLEACDTALKKTIDLARRLPKGRVYDRVEKALQQVGL